MAQRKPRAPDAPVAPPDGTAPDDAPATAPTPLQARQLGPEDLKAFTHPLRMAMYTALNEQGPATATQLAQRLGESSGQTSYHLRQLEKHGFVVDDPDHSGGRERWWRSVGFRLDPEEMLDDPASVLAISAVLEQTVADRARVLRRFVSSVMSGGFPVEQDAVVFDTATLEMTEAETVELIGKVQDLINQYTERAKAATVAGDRDGRRRTRVYFDVLPLPEDAAGEGVGAAGTETGG